MIKDFTDDINDLIAPIMTVELVEVTEKAFFFCVMLDKAIGQYAVRENVVIKDEFVDMVTKKGKKILGVDICFNNTKTRFWYYP
jgi:hypothetical protein